MSCTKNASVKLIMKIISCDVMHIANCFRIYGRWTFSETYFIYILLSTSAPGLQEKNRYSWQILWWLVSTVNTQKTKIMVSNNAGRLSNVQFKLNNTVLECVHRYKYLGLTFCSSGSFMYAQEELYNKASKAYFKLSKDIKSWASYKYACIWSHN